MTEPFVIGRVWESVSAAQLADALTPANPNLCGWLDGTCDLPRAENSWLCEDRHTTVTGNTWRPT